MNRLLRLSAAATVVAAVALPAAALGHGGDRGGSASARTKSRVHRTLRALDRAVDAIDDSDDAGAITKLGTVDKNLARALKAAKTPGSLGLVARAADTVATTTADALDGSAQDLSDALVASLDGALDDRDAIVTSLTASGDSGRLLSRIAKDSTDEADGFTEGAADDDLVASAKSAETDAATQATATATAAQAAAGDDTGGPDGTGGPPHDCPPGGGHGPHGPGGGPTGTAGPTGPHGPPTGPHGPTGPTGPRP